MPETTNTTPPYRKFNSTTELNSAISPDSQLIRACEEYCAAEAAFLSFFPDGANAIEDDDAREVAQRPYRALQANLMETIADVNCHAATVEGLRARARAVVASTSGGSWALEGESHEIVACLINDLMGSEVYRPKYAKLSTELLASDVWLQAIGKAIPSHETSTPRFSYWPKKAAAKMVTDIELWRLPKVVEKVGVSRSTIFKLVNAGEFPEPRQISAQTIAWRSDEIMRWIDERPTTHADDAG